MDPEYTREGAMLLIGLVGGFFSAFFALTYYYGSAFKAWRNTTVKRYEMILNSFGIKLNGRGAWEMHPFDKDETWIKKED